MNTIYDLLIVRWDKEAGALCLYSSDYKGVRSERLAQVITDDDTELVSGTPIFNILNNVELPLVKSLGSSRIGAISFTSYFGPNVTEGLALIEKAQSELNNLACLGYENGERVIWGGTQRRGKVWQQKSGTIAEWLAWTKATWGKVTKKGEEQANVIRDFLKPEKLSAPYASVPITVQWGEQAQQRFNDRQSVMFGEIEVSLYEIDLELGEAGPNGEIHIRVVSDSATAEYSLTIREDLSGGYRHDHVSGPLVRFKIGNGEPVALPEYLLKDPFVVHYADGTYSYNCYHIPANLDAGLFDKEKLEAWDWAGIPLNKESMHKVLVQPGGSVATITDDALRLLATTELYLFKTTQAKLRVIISA